MITRPDHVKLSLTLPGHPNLVPVWVKKGITRKHALVADARIKFVQAGVPACTKSLSKGSSIAVPSAPCHGCPRHPSTGKHSISKKHVPVRAVGSVPLPVALEADPNQSPFPDVVLSYSPGYAACRSLELDAVFGSGHDHEGPFERAVLRVPSGTLKGDLVARVQREVGFDDRVICNMAE